MKKLFFAAVFTVICLCGFGQQASMSTAAQKNLATARAVVNMFESGDFSNIGNYIATDAVDHSGMGEIKGLDSIKAMLNQMNTVMGDFKHEMIHEMADDQYVFQWMNQTSTAKTDAMGMKAGQTITMNIIEVTRFDNAKIVEHWTFLNAADAMKMMGHGDMK